MHVRISLFGASHAVINAMLAAAGNSTINSIEISDESGDMAPLRLSEGNAAQASTNTGGGTPVAPVTVPSAPSGAAPIPTAPSPITLPTATTAPQEQSDQTDESEDESGGASDGTGLDADGLPWDERIHTSTKTKTSKGVWTARRGGPKGAELDAIVAELRASLAGDAPAAAPTPMPVTAPTPMPVTAPTPPMPTAPTPVPVAPPMPQPVPMPTPAPVPVEAPAPVAAPEPAASTDPADFPSFMQQAGPKMGEGENQINAAYLAVVCPMYGIASITDLSLKPELIPSIVAQFRVDGRW